MRGQKREKLLLVKGIYLIKAPGNIWHLRRSLILMLVRIITIF